MPKTSRIQMRTMNALLDLFSQEPALHLHASESELARHLDVSRTTVHAALGNLERQGALIRDGRQMLLAHPPRAADYVNDTQIISPQERIEQIVMERMRQGEWEPGCEFTETDLARMSGVSTATVREFLIGFSRFHLVEKRPRGGWRLLGLDMDFATEVADMRRMLELEAMRHLTGGDVAGWRDKARDLLARHRALADRMSRHYKDFRLLDREFHAWILSHLRNRFALDFLDIVSFVFYYHYKWNVEDEQFFNTAALKEHLRILEALSEGDGASAQAAMRDHLSTSRTNLIRSLSPKETA